MTRTGNLAVLGCAVLAGALAFSNLRRSYGDGGGPQGTVVFQASNVGLTSNQLATLGTFDGSGLKSMRVMLQSSDTAASLNVNLYVFSTRAGVTTVLTPNNAYNFQALNVIPVAPNLAQGGGIGDSASFVYDLPSGTVTLKASAFPYQQSTGTTSFSVVVVGYSQ